MPPTIRRRSSTRARRAPKLAWRLEEAVVLALFDLANHVTRRGERLAALAGVTTQQWLVLLQVARDPNFHTASGPTGGVLASEIARARGVTRASVSAVVSGLKDLGLITEEADPEDGRRRRLTLTAAGADAIERVEPIRRAANDRLLAALDARERTRFLQYLEICLDTLADLGREEAAARPRRD